MERMLNNLGVKNFVMAEDGVEAVETFRKGTFDVILMDIGMPRMDGMEATRQIRLLDKHVVIIACTANATMSQHAECLKIGMNEVITKPVIKETLKNVILSSFKTTDYHNKA